jgi:S-adenosylmethionine hydrolase
VDNFGNLITSISRKDLPVRCRDITIKVKKHIIRGLEETYATGEGLMALVGSSEYLEIALKEGSAAAYLHSGVGDEVRISGTNV